MAKYFIETVFCESILMGIKQLFISKESLNPILANINSEPIRKPVKIENKINVRNS